jgi:cell division protein FtsA
VAIANRSHTVTEEDVHRVIDQARTISIPSEHEVIHVLSKEFAVDDQTGVKEPVGMTGIRLEAEVNIITGLISAIQNLFKAVTGRGYGVKDIIFSPLAAADLVLSEDEKELGVVLIDIGGGTTDILVYIDGGVSYSASIPIAGSHVTNDISIGLRTPLPAAEDIKLKYGCANPTLVDPAEYIQVPSVGGRAERRLYRQELCQIIEPRLEEIMELVDEKLVENGKKPFVSAGAVIIGGGVNLEGTVDVVERVMNIPVRIGHPEGLVGLKDFANDPAMTTAVGLVQYGARQERWRSMGGANSGGLLDRLVGKVKRLFTDM